jgi:hypothetical protein
VNGDGYSDVIVGAPYYDNGQTGEGRAFVYLGGPSGLSTTYAWSAESDQAYAEFGNSVATAGDVNGDGYSDVIVLASHYDNDHGGYGRAFVYLSGPSGLATTPAWSAESTQPYFSLGLPVATAGDVNGDGYSDVIVGAPEYNWYTGGRGACVYLGGPSGLAATPAWTAESDQAGDRFGWSVATAGDVNGDGYSDVIVGAPNYANGQTGEGRAFVYLGGPSGLAATPAWTAESDQAGDRFGWSVATAGDVNGDGYSDVIVGAPYYAYGQTDEERAFVYLGSAAGLATTPAWRAESDQAYAGFGNSVAAAGDVNGDGYSDVIVGAPYYDNGQTDEGRAFVYLGGPSGLSTTYGWSAESDQAGANFGSSVATAGDVNGDGYSDVIVGAPYYDNGQTDEERAFVYLGGPSGLATTPAWSAESDQAYAGFGNSVAAAGDVNADGYSDVIVGAPYYDNGQSAEGCTFVYYGNGGAGLSLKPRQMRGDRSAPVAPLGGSHDSDAFTLALLGRSPYGRSGVKLEWEVKPYGTSFNGAGTQKSAAWTDTGTLGVDLIETASGLSADTLYHWRMRLLYNSASSPFQQRSRWVTLAANGLEEADLRISSPPVTLAISFPGSGGGIVTDTIIGISCNTDCSPKVPYGIQATLHAKQDQFSLLPVWVAPCAVNAAGDCVVTMNGDKGVTAAFNRDTEHMVRIGDTNSYYSTLQEAYDKAPADSLIKAWGVEFGENLNANQNKTVTIEGGYNGAYTENSGYTLLKGILTIKYGSLILENLAIK